MDSQSKEDTSALRKLRDTELTVSLTSDDVRGRTVVDCDGEEIGKVDALYVDESERKVRFLQLKSGGFLGIGARKLLIPVDAVVKVEAERVQIATKGERVAGAPEYDPDLVKESEYYARIYEYYGYHPYWTAGYTYPVLPFAPPPPPGRGRPS